ncbi:hypothetical protein C2W59_01346 [Bacillus pumilus]|uniref:Uncharacterized protein n=1 Tax=Bacillus pumilus TaxID=1408 RepID=A0AB34QYZ9_BACPU|nr:hypothetical protein B4127_0821 [Bacillus pumilus]RAP09047.1 hypothetical protein C2W58_00728 [Bacillus pumilus]RAP19103.1 hypothetical protein C2W59_01346 [Bacillus pumilus]
MIIKKRMNEVAMLIVSYLFSSHLDVRIAYKSGYMNKGAYEHDNHLFSW